MYPTSHGNKISRAHFHICGFCGKGGMRVGAVYSNVTCPGPDAAADRSSQAQYVTATCLALEQALVTIPANITTPRSDYNSWPSDGTGWALTLSRMRVSSASSKATPWGRYSDYRQHEGQVLTQGVDASAARQLVSRPLQQEVINRVSVHTIMPNQGLQRCGVASIRGKGAGRVGREAEASWCLSGDRIRVAFKVRFGMYDMLKASASAKKLKS